MSRLQDSASLRVALVGLLAISALLATPLVVQADSGRLAWSGDRSQLIAVEDLAEWRSGTLDIRQLLLEDLDNEGNPEIPYRVGFPMDVDLTPANSGTWEELRGGDRLWRLKVVTEDALWTVLGFDLFRIQPGGALSVQDESGQTILGPYTANDIRKHGELWFPPITGDTVLVELFWPASLRDVEPAIHLGRVSHGYKAWGSFGRGQTPKLDDDGLVTRGFGDSGSCNIDTACPEADEWQNETRSVVMVLVGGSGNCSGSLLNTTAQDCKTILLTADHCGEDGPGTSLGFNFVREGCGTGNPIHSETTQTLTGGTLLATLSDSDFTLIEMDEAPQEEWNVYFAGWSRDPTPADYTYVISHPRGDVKKIAYDSDPPIDGTNYGPNHWRIDDSNPDPAHLAYEWGTTEPASSGSPLFDHNHRVVGQLHGGTASCTSDTWDEYGKVDASWTGGGTPATRMSDWLDPLGTGAMTVDGIDHSICLYQPAGEVLMTRDLYSCADTVEVTLRDDNIPGDPATVDVLISSATEVAPETLTLVQINPGEGRYVGSIPVTTATPVSGDGLLSVNDGDILTVNYVDADDGEGGTNITVKDNADVDCQSPVITNVQSSEVTGNSALITWDTDEPADSAVTHGLTPPGTVTDSDPELVVAHALRLHSLQECSVHYYSVASTDVVGNSASDDNFGASYNFETGRNVNPTYPSTADPIPIQDNTTHLSVIDVTDSKTVLDVKVGLEITHTFTGDLDITLISPLGTRVLLVADRGGSGENFSGTLFDDAAATPIGSGSAPFTGSFQPEQPLAGIAGENSLGQWQLEVIDDAGGDTGSLNSWTLELNFPAQACGVSATYGDHALEADVCSAGAGDSNSYWDTGEMIQFSLTVRNDGTDPLTGVTAQVTPLTPGVVMFDSLADVGDIPSDSSAPSLPPHFAALLPLGMICGQDVVFEVVIDSNEGSWTEGFAQIAGQVIPGVGVAFTEDFEATGIPSDWTIIDGFGDRFTWYTDNAGDPAGCANTNPAPPLAGNWAAVDSDCTGSGVAMDEELISPLIDMTGSITVALDFDHYFNWLGPETADVDVRSSLTGGSWVNVARWQADTSNPDHATLDITAQASNVNDLQIRWHYYDADFEWYWYVDNVVVSYTLPADCLMPECSGGPLGPPPIPDGDSGSIPLTADLLSVDGSQILLTWDDQCSPVGTNLLYGSLGQVSSLTLGGADCGIAGPHVWDPAPAGDLWFLLVTDDGAGTESSWGFGAAGERNGLAQSGMCGSTSKDATGTCP